MQLAQRLDLLVQLQAYMLGNNAQWQAVKEKAYQKNGWFIPQFIELSIKNIATHLLSRNILQQLVSRFNIPNERSPLTIGIVMPGNIPLAGFYDFLCAFLAGHRQRIKLSPNDDVLLKHLVDQLAAWNAEVRELVMFDEMLKGCDAYLTTDNKNTEALKRYFSKYPHIIHRTGSAVAILFGQETRQQLELLADDVFQYFGQGCLNITKLYVPQQYDFIPLLKIFEKYGFLIDHNKYKNNYDYQLALLILNKEFYMTNGSILLTESASVASPVARLHFEYYTDEKSVIDSLADPGLAQVIAGTHQAPFGRAQQSVVCDQGGAATLQFLLEL
jgi:hypothetical protein